MENQKGYTLIELILTIIVVGIIAAVSAQILMRGIDSYNFIMNRKDAVQHARVGMDRMLEELLLVRSIDIISAGDTQVSFWDYSGASVNFRRYTVNNVWQLYRKDDFLAGSVAFLDFDYYNSSNQATSLAWSVRRINIELTVQALGGAGSVPVRCEVFPRNFMYSNFQ